MKTFANCVRAVAAAGLCLLNGAVQASGKMPQAQPGPETERAEARAARQADSVLSTLTLRQKIAQLMVIEIGSAESAKRKLMQNELVEKERVGGVILMDDGLVSGMKRLNELHRMAAVPLLVTIDGEWGVSMRFKEVPVFPRQMQLGALPSDSLVRAVGHAIGKECADLNIHVNFAPDVDINNNPENPVINTRSFGEDKEKVAAYGMALIEGMQAEGVSGSVKHFPGHGDTDTDSHKGLPCLTFGRGRLDSLELYPFRRLLESRPDMVMVGHLSIPALDSTGTPASVSKPIVTDLLRNELGYDGIITTDALNMNGVCGSLEKKMVPLEAYKAGADLLLMPVQAKEAITEIEKAVRSGWLSADSLDERCRKILRLKARAGMFERSYRPQVDLADLERRMIKQENLQLMEEVALQSMTVLFNREARTAGTAGGPVLPVGDLKRVKIAYVGLGAKPGKSEMAALLRRYAPVDTLVFRSDIPQDTLLAVRERLKGHDLVIVGIHKTDSRPNRGFGLDTAQMRLLTQWAAGQDLVAAYFGSPYAVDKIPEYDRFRAFVVGYADTPENNRAAVQVIFGGAPARGVLPVSTADFAAGGAALWPERTRLGFRTGPENAPYRVTEGQVRGNYIPEQSSVRPPDADRSGNGVPARLASGDTVRYDTPVPLGEIAPLLTLLPRVAHLMDKGCFRATDSLDDLLRLPIPKHADILVRDLLIQSSGLPAVEEDFAFDMNNITNLNRFPARDWTYSRANLYYLYRILKEYGDSDERLRAQARELFASLGMDGTVLEPETGGEAEAGADREAVAAAEEDAGFAALLKVRSTADDLSKFVQMIYNGGRYGGTAVCSPGAAALLSRMLPYYCGHSSGLRMITDSDGKEISYRVCTD